MKKNNLLATLAMVALSIVSVVLTSCSYEDLATFFVKISAVKDLVTVDDFDSNVEILLSQGDYDLLSDGNKIKREGNMDIIKTSFSYSSIDDNNREVKVVYTAKNEQGDTRTSETKYVQKRIAPVVVPDDPTPIEPTNPEIVDYRLDYTRDVYATDPGEKNNTCSGVVNTWLVSIYNDGHEEREKVLDNVIYTMYRIAGGVWDDHRFISSTDDLSKAYLFNSVTRDGDYTEVNSPAEGVTVNTKMYTLHYNMMGLTSEYVFIDLLNYNVEFSDFTYSIVVDGKELSFSYPMVEFSYSDQPDIKVENRNLNAFVDQYSDEFGVNYTATHPYTGTYVTTFHNYIDGSEVDTLTLSIDLYKEGNVVTDR